MKHEAYTFMVGMERREAKRRLRAARTGVLAIADEGDAYAFPVAHSYADDGLFLRLGIVADSEKREYVRSPGQATYVVYETNDASEFRRLESWSVIATGSLQALAEEEQFETAEINRRFAPIPVFGEAVPDLEIHILRFEIDTLTGRMTPDVTDGPDST